MHLSLILRMTSVLFGMIGMTFAFNEARAVEIQPPSLAGYSCVKQNATPPTSPQNPPQIVVIGEKDHESVRDVTERARHVQDAVQGKYFIGLEGLINGVSWLDYDIPGVKKNNTPTARVFGLEDQLSRGFASLVRERNQLIRFTDPKDEASRDPNLSEKIQDVKVGFLSDVKANPETQKAWRQLRAEGKFKNADQEKLARVIDQMLTDPRFGARSVGEALKSFKPWQLVSNVQALITATGDCYVRRLGSSEYRDRKDVPADREKARIYFHGGLSWDEEEAMMNEWVTKWRNRSFAVNIKKLYCQAYQENKPLYVVVGNDHVDDLVQLIPGQVVAGTQEARVLTHRTGSAKFQAQ